MISECQSLSELCVCSGLFCLSSFALLHLGDNARIDLIELVEDQQNADAAPGNDVADDVDTDQHLRLCCVDRHGAGEAYEAHQGAEDRARHAGAELLAGGGCGNHQALYADAALPCAVLDNVSEHGVLDAAEAALADAAHDAGEQRKIEGARVDEQGNRTDNGDDCADESDIALAKLGDERGEDKNGDDLRNGFEGRECAEQVAVAEDVLRIISVAGAGDGFIEGEEHGEHEEHDEVLVGDAELDAHPERNVLAVLGLGLFLDTLVAVLEA